MAVLVAMTGNIALLMVVIVCSFFVTATRRGELPLRQGFGLRTPATTANEQTWAVAHEAAIPALRRVCVVAVLSMIPSVLFGAVLGHFFPLGAESVALLLVFAGFAVTGWFLAKAVRVADAAAHALLYADAELWPDAEPAEPAPSRTAAAPTSVVADGADVAGMPAAAPAPAEDRALV